MTLTRLISLPTHGALELLAGMAILAAPFVLGFAGAATVIAVCLGALVVGLALAAATDDRGLPVMAHAAFDWALALALFAAALLVAWDGDKAAGIVFGAAAATQLLLVATTRYVRN